MREEIFMNNFFDEKQELFDRLDNVISTLPANPSSLMDILFEAQNIFGYLPQEVQSHIAKKLNISRSYVSRLEKRALIKLLREHMKEKP